MLFPILGAPDNRATVPRRSTPSTSHSGAGVSRPSISLAKKGLKGSIAGGFGRGSGTTLLRRALYWWSSVTLIIGRPPEPWMGGGGRAPCCATHDSAGGVVGWRGDAKGDT